MTTAKTKRWVLVDAPAERLLDEIGVPDLEYYSARDERAVSEALSTWPLLAMVTKALRTELAEPDPTQDPDQTLRVVVDRTGLEEPANDPASSPEEAS